MLEVCVVFVLAILSNCGHVLKRRLYVCVVFVLAILSNFDKLIKPSNAVCVVFVLAILSNELVGDHVGSQCVLYLF